MQKLKRLFAGLVMVMTLLTAAPVTAHAEWKSDSTGWWYTEGNSYSVGWRYLDGNWYYFNSDGYMLHDTYVGNCYLRSDGAWTTAPSASTASYTVNNKSQTAYLSATGDKYHSKPNCGNMNPNKATKTTVAEAESQGHGRCSKCW